MKTAGANAGPGYRWTRCLVDAGGRRRLLRPVAQAEEAAITGLLYKQQSGRRSNRPAAVESLIELLLDRESRGVRQRILVALST